MAPTRSGGRMLSPLIFQAPSHRYYSVTPALAPSSYIITRLFGTDSVEKWAESQAIYRNHVRARDTKNFILSQRARKVYYLYSGIATYIGSRKGLKETRLKIRGNE